MECADSTFLFAYFDELLYSDFLLLVQSILRGFCRLPHALWRNLGQRKGAIETGNEEMTFEDCSLASKRTMA